MDSRPIVAAVRRLLMFTLLTGMLGIVAELLITSHTEDLSQWIPIALTLVALLSLGWLVIAGNQASVRVFQFVMASFLVSGLAGIGLHYKGRVEFKLESSPSLSGFALFREAMRSKSPPALAPGAMILLGLIGLTYARCRIVKRRMK